MAWRSAVTPANHIPLTTLTPTEQRDELQLSKLLLEWRGMGTIYSFSYPNGAYDDSIVTMLAEENYLTAVTVRRGSIRSRRIRHRLHRVNIPAPHLGLTEFRLRLLKADLAARAAVRVAELPEGLRAPIEKLCRTVRGH